MPLKTLLLVGHAPSTNTQKILLACQQGFDESAVEHTRFVVKTALETQPKDVIHADAILLFSTENLGYMSGLMKDFFDRNYYPCIELTQGKPCAAIIRAGNDGTGTRRALEAITTGLRWHWVQEPLTLRGDWQDDFLTQAKELCMAMAVALDGGMI